MYLFCYLTSYVTLKMRWTKPYPAAWPAQVCHTVSAMSFNILCIYEYQRDLSYCHFFVDEDMDELEEELKSLLDETKPDSVSGLPEVPTNGLRPSGEPSLPGDDLLSSLPAVPYTHLDITSEQLEEELNQLTLTDSGLRFQTSPFFFLCWTVI